MGRRKQIVASNQCNPPAVATSHIQISRQFPVTTIQLCALGAVRSLLVAPTSVLAVGGLVTCCQLRPSCPGRGSALYAIVPAWKTQTFADVVAGHGTRRGWRAALLATARMLTMQTSVNVVDAVETFCCSQLKSRDAQTNA